MQLNACNVLEDTSALLLAKQILLGTVTLDIFVSMVLTLQLPLAITLARAVCVLKHTIALKDQPCQLVVHLALITTELIVQNVLHALEAFTACKNPLAM
jgi:hypothetical protein